MKPRRSSWVLVLTIASAGFPLLGACAESTQPPEPRPNVVLIVVDTLRADRMPFLGCPQPTAPFLDELAQRSLVFENAWSPSSWTLPAAVSTLTSVHPSQHGVTSLDGLELGPGDEPVPVNCIPEEVETLTEILGKAGYRTYGIVSNILVGSEVGFDRGFDRFVKLEDEDADAVNHWATNWRDEMLAQEPFFLYVHYIDPHDTFHAREPWFDPTLPGAESGWPVDQPDVAPDTYGDLDWIMTRLDPGPDWLGELRAEDLSSQQLDELMHWMRAAYDSEIGFVDARIRTLYGMLGLEDSIVLFLADHGEEFYEHGALTHGQNLHAETVRVPLLLQVPGEDAPRGRVPMHVSTLDVVPTLRSLLGLRPSAQDQGQDLLSEALRQPVLAQLVNNSGQHDLGQDLRSVVRGDYRLISPRDGSPQLYDVREDPGETVNLAAERPSLVAELLGELEALEAAPVYPRAVRIPGAASEAMLEHLQGIGYTGGD